VLFIGTQFSILCTSMYSPAEVAVCTPRVNPPDVSQLEEFAERRELACGGVGPERGLRGGGRRGWCEEWARRG
jgi:hypothetical protein